MATPYSDIFTVFSSLITDYSFVELEESDLTTLLTIYLHSSCTKFSKCNKDLSDRTEATSLAEGTFNFDLTDMEVLILANYMIDEWLSPKLNTSDLLKQILGTKDYNLFSSANQIKELRALREDTRDEINRLIIDYSYNDLNQEDIS